MDRSDEFFFFRNEFGSVRAWPVFGNEKQPDEFLFLSGRGVIYLDGPGTHVFWTGVNGFEAGAVLRFLGTLFVPFAGVVMLEA